MSNSDMSSNGSFMPPERLVFPRSASEKYVPLLLIESGVEGLIYTCLPIDDFPKASNGNHDLTYLRNKVLAIKIFRDESGDEDNEIAAEYLKTIRIAQGDATPREKRLLPLTFDIHNEGETPWYTMTAVQGRDLSDIIWTHKLSLPLIFHIFLKVLDALIFLRGLGLLHYDIQNEENVMLEVASAPLIGKLSNVVIVDLDCLHEISPMKERVVVKQLLLLMGRIMHRIEDADFVSQKGLDKADVEKAVKFLRLVRNVDFLPSNADVEYLRVTFGDVAERIRNLGMNDG